MRAIAIATFIAFAASNASADCDALRARLQREHDRARTWNIAWGIGLGVAAIAQAGASPLLGDYKERDTLYVGAAESVIGAGASLVTPLFVDAAPELACSDLDAAVHAGGIRERNAFYLNHVGGLVVNLAGAAVLWHYTSFGNAALSFAVGYAVALARTYTAPRWAWHPTLSIDQASATAGVATAF